MNLEEMSVEKLITGIQAEAIHIGMGGYTAEHIERAEKIEAEILHRFREKDEKIKQLEDFYIRVHKLEYIAGIVKPYQIKIEELQAKLKEKEEK